MSRQEIIDKYISKWISRKLIVFAVGSVGLFVKVIDSSDWVIIATVYMSVEGAITVVETILKAKQNVGQGIV
jgi:hypothetical protein